MTEDTKTLTVDEAREIVKSSDPSRHDMTLAIIALSYSDWYGDRLVAHELEKARFLKPRTKLELAADHRWTLP